MAKLQDLPIATVGRDYSITSKVSNILIRCNCKDLELPLRVEDYLIVSGKDFDYKSSVSVFVKSQGKPYCPLQQGTSNFYILVRRGVIDYKLSVKDLRLELLKLEETLK